MGRTGDRPGILARGAGGGLVAGALALAALALAQGPATVCAGWLLAGVAMALCLYDPAFAALHHISGTRYRRAVTALTLFGGFASTVFWPASQWLSEAVGWRATFAVYAVLHLVLSACRCTSRRCRGRARTKARRRCRHHRRRTAAVAAKGGALFAWLAVALVGRGVHRLGGVRAPDRAHDDGRNHGRRRGADRRADRADAGRGSRRRVPAGRNLRAQAVGTLAFAMLARRAADVPQVRGVKPVAIGFAALYGFSNGVMTIVRGTVPAELFGRHEFGTLLGRLARPQLIARAVAPVALTLCFPFDPTRTITSCLLARWRRVASRTGRRCESARRVTPENGDASRFREAEMATPRGFPRGAMGEKRSQPISRVLLRRVCMRYDRHSSRPIVAAGLKPPTRGLGEQLLQCVRLLGVAPDGGCRVSPAGV